MGNCAGLRFCLIAGTAIILGNKLGNSCRLLLLVADVVEDKTAYDGSKCACDHSHAELNEDVHILTSLLKRKLTAFKGSGIDAIISEKIYPFNTKNDVAVVRAYSFAEILDSESLIVAELMKRYESLTKI